MASYYREYFESQKITSEGYEFYALIMAAMRQADSDNAEKLKEAFPEVWNELLDRYKAPNGLLEGEQ